MTAQLEQIDIAHRIINMYPDDLMFASSIADIDAAKGAGEDRLSARYGRRSYDRQLTRRIAELLQPRRALYDVDAFSIAHDWADSATDDARHEGITEFGREVVREMNRLGMLVDLSHVSVETMNDVLDVAEAPVIFSHSSARRLTNHLRNVPDSILERLDENGGVVMVTFIPPIRQRRTPRVGGRNDSAD